MDDALSSLLHGVRPQGALFDQSAFVPPWSLRFEERTPLALLTMFTGTAWVIPDGAEPVRLSPCDVAIVTGPEPYTVADSPGTAPLAVIDGDECRGPDGRPYTDTTGMCGPALGNGIPSGIADGTGNGIADGTGNGIASGAGVANGTGNGAGVANGNGDGYGGGACAFPEGPFGPGPADTAGTTVLLKGVYQVEGSVSDRVLTALPRVALVPSVPEGCPPLAMIAQELARDIPGRQVILDRLLDLLLVTSLREWFALPGSDAPAWYRAHGDPQVGRALKLMHGDPARPWTVASLAAAVGASRARFAHRFTELVGQSPMAYLTEWRICRAADLLARTDATVDAVSRQVGYSNAYALSVAFKRTRGVRPSEHRALARAGR